MAEGLRVAIHTIIQVCRSKRQLLAQWQVQSIVGRRLVDESVRMERTFPEQTPTGSIMSFPDQRSQPWKTSESVVFTDVMDLKLVLVSSFLGIGRFRGLVKNQIVVKQNIRLLHMGAVRIMVQHLASAEPVVFPLPWEPYERR